MQEQQCRIEKLRIAVVGSRIFNEYNYLHRKLTDLLWEIVDYWGDELPLEIIIVSGGARGADSIAEQWAKEWGYQTMIFSAEWDKYGKSAGYRRNQQIIDASDVVIAFWDGTSKGTKHSIDIATKQGKPIFIFSDWVNESS